MSTEILSFMGRERKSCSRKGIQNAGKCFRWRLLCISGGGHLSLESVYAADVTGGDVLIDGTPVHPIPSAPIAGGVITNAADPGNVHGNKLTLDGSAVGIQSDAYGGYTLYIGIGKCLSK